MPEAPSYDPGANICLDGKGEPMIVRGRVLDIAGSPMRGALVDVWQTNDDGFYDVQQKGVQPDWNLRGVFTTDEAGEYWFDGQAPLLPHPRRRAGRQAPEALGRHPNRTAHIHFIVGAKGFAPIVTHYFVTGDPYLETDAVFGVKESLIVDFTRNDDSKAIKESTASTGRSGKPNATLCCRRGKAADSLLFLPQ